MTLVSAERTKKAGFAPAAPIALADRHLAMVAAVHATTLPSVMPSSRAMAIIPAASGTCSPWFMNRLTAVS
jgi:hypothetical protein